jgi:hypothetical protein
MIGVEATASVNLSALSRLRVGLRGRFVKLALNQIVRIYASDMQRRFATLSRGGSWEGQRWYPLARSTVLRRRGRGGRLGSLASRADEAGARAGERLFAAKLGLARAMRGPWRGRAARVGRAELRVFNARMAAQKAARRQRAVASAIGSAAILVDTGTLRSGLVVGSQANRVAWRGQTQVSFGFSGARHPSGQATIARIASYHQRGTRTAPRRAILVGPSRQAVRTMRAAVQREFSRLVRRAGGR